MVLGLGVVLSWGLVSLQGLISIWGDFKINIQPSTYVCHLGIVTNRFLKSNGSLEMFCGRCAYEAPLTLDPEPRI